MNVTPDGAATMHEPVVLQSSDGALVAMVTEPTGKPQHLGVVFFSPGGYTISAQRNRWATHMAEKLAHRGFHTIRFDYHGVGDSTADIEQFVQEKPLVEDGRAAIQELARRGITDLILVGQCFGARTALALVPEVEGLCGVFAISPPMRDIARGEGNASRMAHDSGVGEYARQAARVFKFSRLRDRTVRRQYWRMGKMFVRARCSKMWRAVTRKSSDPTPWVSRNLLGQLDDLSNRDIPAMLIYGAADKDSTEFEKATVGRLGSLMDASRIDAHILEGRVHNLGRVDVQDTMVEMIVQFSDQCAVEARQM